MTLAANEAVEPSANEKIEVEPSANEKPEPSANEKSAPAAGKETDAQEPKLAVDSQIAALKSDDPVCEVCEQG
ncbi:hypothetical protein [uncultured Shewanella sp.]|uniref:hypothetical protein n=1 Tax=uncultured Shewanella sp. TaxID=173975 RepID=UPI002620A18B|nr:hypothetical protein [uncultured Shewanella sp.]